MSKLIVLLIRRDGIDPLQFDVSWRLKRAPQVATLSGLVRYVRNEIVEGISREHMAESSQAIAGLEELWFEDEVACDAALKIIRANKSFEVTGGGFPICAFAVSEQLIYDRPRIVAQPIKRLSLLTRKQGMTTAAFSHYWRSVHAPLAFCHRFVDRYVQNHVIGRSTGTETGEAERFEPDGIGEFLISDLLRMQEDYRSDAGIRMKQDVSNFVESARTYVVAAREVRLAGVG